MKRIRGWISRWAHQDEWPFMMFLTFVFAFIFIWTVFDSPRLRDPWMLILFTLLFNIHLALHWLTFTWLEKQWSVLLYLAIQSALIFVLVSVSGSLGPLIGLYMGMIGESAGLLRQPWKIALGVAAFLALSAVNYWVIMRTLTFQWWALAIFPMTLFVILYVLMYTRQAEARDRAQKLLVELEAANRQLTEYADRIEDLTLTTERQRMARELHDTLAQGLAGLILQLEAADSHLDSHHPERARQIIIKAMERARNTLTESRQVIDNLRTGKWRPQNLEDAIHLEADHFYSFAGIPCSVEVDLPAALPDALHDLMIRAVAEGLSNIARHAKATTASLRIVHRKTMLVVEIRDDGTGFNPQTIPSGHYGLIGLQERARLAGGTCIVESGNSGTLLQLTLPAEAA